MQNNTETPPATITPHSIPSSKKDKQVADLLFLKYFACRVIYVKNELTIFASLFTDQSKLTQGQISALTPMKKT